MSIQDEQEIEYLKQLLREALDVIYGKNGDQYMPDWLISLVNRIEIACLDNDEQIIEMY